MPTDPRMAQYSSAAAPDNPPDAHLAVAGTATNASDAIDSAQSLAAYGGATSQMAHMQSLSSEEQRSMWAGATGEQQSMLYGVGYRPPSEPAKRNWLSRGIHDVLGAPAAAYRQAERIPVVGDAVKQVGETTANAGKLALRGLASGGEFVKHTYRAGELANIEDVSPDGTVGKIAKEFPLAGAALNFTRGQVEDVKAGVHAIGNVIHLSTPSDWADAWDKTTNGDRTFDPNKERDIQVSSGLDETTFQLAKAAASSDKDVSAFLAQQLDAGMSPADVAALGLKVHDQGSPMTPDQLQASQAFHDAVQQLKDAKLSFGRSMVPDYMWHSNHALAELFSGFNDALFSQADPLIIGGKVTKTAKVARYGFKTLEELDAANSGAKAVRYREDIVKYLSEERYGELLHRRPELAPVISSLAQEGVKTTDGLASKMVPTSTQGITDAFQAQKEAEAAVDSAISDSDARKLIKAAGLANIKTQQEFADWQKANMLSLHIFSGHGSSVPTGTNMVPTLTRTGKLFLDSKDTLRKKIDWAADKTFDLGDNGALDLSGRLLSGGVNLMGTVAKRLTTLIPEGMTFNPMDPNAIVTVQRFARAYLPAVVVEDLMNKWALAGDTAAKRHVYTEMLGKTFEAAGVHLSDDSSLMRHYVSVINNGGEVTQKYAANGIDLLPTDDGMVAAHGIFEHHLTEEWSLPSMKELYANAHREGFNKMVYGISNNALAHSFSAIWKPVQLLRMGFPVRTSLEEMAGGIARNGFFPMLQARVAGRAIGSIVTNGEREGFGRVGPFANFNPVEAMFARGMKALPKSLRPEADTALKLQSFWLANRTSHAVRYLAGKFPGVHALAASAEKHADIFGNAFTSEASAVHAGKYGFTNDVADGTISKFGDRMGKTSISLVKPTGEYRQFENGDDFYMANWMKHLDDIASSGLARKILKHMPLMDTNPDQLHNLVADYIQQPGFKKYWDSSIRSRKLRDKRVVGYDATERDAAMDWAHVAIQHVEDMLPKREMVDDTINSDQREALIKSLLANKEAPDMAGLQAIPKENRPDRVSGREMHDIPSGGLMGMFREFVGNGFVRMGGAMDSWSRQPLYLAAVHKADKELTPLVGELLGDTPMGEELLSALVRNRANAEVLPFIHDPKVRSQMNVLTQNLAPFQFAQEQFWKRWARTFVHSPEAMRKAQLAHHALGATGMTHINDSGDEIFTYPLSGFAQKAVANGLNAVGIPAKLPVQQAFTGELKMVAPGLDHTLSPSFGPLVSIPLNKLAEKFPELRPTQHALLGDIGTNRTVMEQIFPSTVVRALRLGNDDRTSTQYANAEMRAIQDLYAAKKGLPPNASAADKELFMARVKNWTRINMGIRAVLGFGVPAAPITEIGDTQIAHELRVLSESGMDFTAAMQALVERDPDAFPYTVFQSVGTGAATLPATAASAAMLDKYGSFFNKHRSAGGFFLPTASKDDAYSNEAYQDQLMAGLRQRRTPAEFLEQLMFKQAATTYYDTVDAYNRSIKGLKGAERDARANKFAQWKQTYLDEHPTFDAVMQDPKARQKRSDTLSDLQKALLDPSAPQNDQIRQITDLVDTYDAYNAQIQQIAGLRATSAVNQRKAMKLKFATWAKKYATDNPGALDVYNRLIRPDVDPDGATTTGA